MVPLGTIYLSNCCLNFTSKVKILSAATFRVAFSLVNMQTDWYARTFDKNYCYDKFVLACDHRNTRLHEEGREL